MAAYRRVDGFKSPAVHRDQLRAQRSVTSMGELYLCSSSNSSSSSKLVTLDLFLTVGIAHLVSRACVFTGVCTCKPSIRSLPC